MKKQHKITLSLLAAAVIIAGCAAAPSSADLDKLTADIVKASFRDQGIVKASVLDTDETNRACSAADVAGKPLDEKTALALQAANFKTIKWPANGKFLGSWQAGEKLAQSGRGLTWTDKADTPTGGNCYNCHQIGPNESSFGTVGPSLLGYGKTRGNSPEIQKFTYSKIFNAKAFNLCSEMPRFGHAGALNEKQIKDLVALLLDPASPVNK
jgi:sulfur-oxidizing protein SoxX